MKRPAAAAVSMLHCNMAHISLCRSDTKFPEKLT
jgi:hypothetical protein